MIKVKVKTDKETIEKQIPEGWHEVKLKHIVNLEKWDGDNTDIIGLLSCFLELDERTLNNTKSNLWLPVFHVLNFVFNPPKWASLKMPKKLIINDKEIKVPRALGLERFGQRVLALQIMLGKKDKIEQIPEVLAVYFQPLFDGKFSRERVEIIKEYILELPAIDAVPVGRFFFLKLIKARNFGRIGLPQFLTTLNQKKRIKRPDLIS